MPNPAQLRSFVDWFIRCTTGDEKGSTQIFLDHLFPRFRSLHGGGTSFADYVRQLITEI